MSKFIDADRLRAEIEKIYKSEIAPWLSGVSAASAIYDYVLPLIDTLEKSEKPIQDELEKEIEEYFPESSFYTGFNSDDVIEIAYHFAKWGAEHTPLPEDTVQFNKGVAEGKRLMMEDAVEGVVVQDLKGVNRVKSFSKIPEGLHFGDKVRIIILPKED